MATFGLTPQVATPGAAWSNLDNAIDGDSGTFATCNSTATLSTLTNFEDIADFNTIGHPQTSIDYIDIVVRGDGQFSVAEITVALIGLDSATASAEIDLPSGTPTNETVRLYRKLDGTRFQHDEVYNNTDFGIIIKGNSGTPIRIYAVSGTVTYTQDEYLHGDRSTFPVSHDDVALVTNATDNSTEDTDFVIRESQVNTLGDAIIAVQRLLKMDTAFVNTLIPAKVTIGDTSQEEYYFFSALITGTKAVPIFGKEVWTVDASNFLNLDITDPWGTETVSFFNPTDLDVLDASADLIRFPFISGIGWVDNGVTREPFHVSPVVSILAKDAQDVAYSFSLVTSPPTPMSTPIHGANSSAYAQVYQYTGDTNYSGDYYFEIRIFGIGVKSR